MPKYMSHVSFTTEGVKGLQREKAAQRKNEVTKLIENAGGKLEAFYFAFGKDDVIAIIDVPDNIAAASISVAVNAAGHVHLKMTPLLTVEDMDKAIAKSEKFRHVPGD